MKKLQVNKKYLGTALVLTILLILAFIILPSRGNQITTKNFPKKIGNYSLTNLQTIDKDTEINAILGQRIRQTFISNFVGPGANVTLWVLIPAGVYKETVIANMLVSSMSKKPDMFFSFSTITEGKYPVAVFTGPGEAMHNYIFFKNGKVYWLSIEINGEVNERAIFKEFFDQF